MFFFLFGNSCRSYCKEIIIIVQCIPVLLICIIVSYGEVPLKYDHFQRFVAMLYRKILLILNRHAIRSGATFCEKKNTELISFRYDVNQSLLVLGPYKKIERGKK
jgi:hypothetical protein